MTEQNNHRELPRPSEYGIVLAEEEKAPKKCSKCKLTKPGEVFFRIIKRRDYGTNCDEDGESCYLKPTMQCVECRIPQRLRMRERYAVKQYQMNHMPRNGATHW